MGKYFVIDLFSGSGGSAWGFKSAGFNIGAAVEIDKTASASFKANFPTAKVFAEDIQNITGEQLLNQSGLNLQSKDSLIILACPPCQGFSSARRNDQRHNDPRNNLVTEFVRLVKEIQPIAFVMENVPGLAKGIGKTLFEQTIQELKKIGYKNHWQEILEVADYGVPERRKRLVMIGTRNSNILLSKPPPTHRNPDKIDTNLPGWKTVREAISDLPPIRGGEKNPKDLLHKAARVSELNLERLKFTPENGGSRTAWPYRLWLKCHKKLQKKQRYGYGDIYGRMKWDSPSPTMTGGCVMISKGRFGHPKQNRAISLREAARLQTFPDSFIFEGNFGEIAKQIGNAVPPFFAQKIAESLLIAINEAKKVKNQKKFPITKEKINFYVGSSV